MNTISVCMATRNGEKYLLRQLESILSQIGHDDEIVISDDSSTDRTVEIVKGLQDTRIHLLEHNSFFNPIFNFENALRHATGSVIVLSDQDDIWIDTKIEVIRKAFTDHRAGIKLLVLDGMIVDEYENVLDGSIFDRMHSGSGLIKNVYANTYMGCCMAFTRDLLEIALPFPANIPMHDMWLGLLAELFGSVTFMREVTVKYRRHQATATSLQLQINIGEQLRRRFHLVSSLAKRYVATKQRRKGCP